ncbi:hypothetical protein SASPL_111114 [Salvia splendens]|uniref:RING-type domain-containing protein n=1 Tax=Salvia splendens TaxID=180675 RepID=A0A8X8YA54_SALSN|nr:putative E3 ubiquitin-protein ligase RF298 [Salvia splendens]XP_042053593.1 putative E3 ubiquitin-protein ligase RF298 [Salvia splendens]KAG6426877.1 hypothetical protein SASPL_111114 [Salvia splendens]
MGENCSVCDCSVDCGSNGVSSLSANDKGRNKRKFLSDLSLDIPAEASNLSLEETFRNALNELGSMMERSGDAIGEHNTDKLQGSDWDNPVVCQLEELLLNSLKVIFGSAVKKIIESGYTEEVAEWAILYSSLFNGGKDAVSNVVDSALSILKRDKDISTTKHPVFEGLESLVDYTLLEMICVLREIRPSLSVSEAMWCLLISDLNLVNTCPAEGGTVGGSCSQEAAGDSQALPQSKSETSSTSQIKDSNDSGSSKQMNPQRKGCEPKSPSVGELASPGKECVLAALEAKGNLSSFVKEHFLSSFHGNTMDEKAVGNKKGLSVNSKRDMLRQKAFQFEKHYKGRLTKGAFKAKVAAWGSMVLDKSLRAPPGCATIAMKGADHSKLPTPAGTSSSAAEKNSHPSSNSPPLSSACDASKGGANVSDTPKAIDYHALIPFDETLQKCVPQDDKDEAILTLVPYKQDIEKELQGWMEWANEKVMQAARRLGKDQAELKMLRQEKEEMEKFKKEKQTLEESTIKRLSGMEHALTNATGQIEVANCTIHRLEEENHLLKNDMLAAKMQAIRAVTNLESALEREQQTLKKLQSWEADKGIVQDELTNLQRQITSLNKRLEKARGRKDQFKALWKQEEKEKSKAQKNIDSLKSKLDEEEALMKVEADSIKQASEKEMQRCEADIKRLQKMIMELSLEADKSKIAALNMGYGSYMTGLPGSEPPKVTNGFAVFQDNASDSPDVKPERECVMCMTDEISVVFIPCAHQVLCTQCNVIHEKQGMSDCPSCRTTIQKRVSVSYRC